MSWSAATDRDRVLHYRADGHHLGARLPRSDIAAAAGAVGLRDVRGSGLLSLHARVAGVGPGDLDEARRDGALVDIVGPRGVGTLVPPADVAVFTLGSLPSDEASLRVRLTPFLPDLDRSGHTAVEALELATSVAREALSHGAVGIGELSGALTTALPELSPVCRGRCGVAHIESLLFDLVGESGIWRHESADGARLYVPTDPPTGRDAARAELVRRYLRCYGPSTAGQFAAWCGIGVSDAARSLAGAGVVEIARGRFLCADDRPRFEAPPAIAGVRILPPRDPYLLDRDRATLVPDRWVRGRLWRAMPTDGLILVDGEPVATWRSRTRRAALHLDVQPFLPLDDAAVAALGREAAAIAELRGCTSVDIDLQRTG